MNEVQSKTYKISNLVVESCQVTTNQNPPLFKISTSKMNHTKILFTTRFARKKNKVFANFRKQITENRKDCTNKYL